MKAAVLGLGALAWAAAGWLGCEGESGPGGERSGPRSDVFAQKGAVAPTAGDRGDAVQPAFQPPPLDPAETDGLSAEELVRKGKHAYNALEFARALAFFREARARKPEAHECHWLEGAVLAKMGKRRDAYRSYERYLEVCPDCKFARATRSLLRDYAGMGMGRPLPSHRDGLGGASQVPKDEGPVASDQDSLGGSELHRLALSGQAEEVVAALKAGADPAARDRYGHTPVHRAAHAGRKDLVQVYLEHGFDPRTRDLDGRTLLHAAARAEEGLALARMLLERGLDANAADSAGITPLHLASTAGMARLLIENGADVNAESQVGKYQRTQARKDDGQVRDQHKGQPGQAGVEMVAVTPLHRAAAADRLDVVRVLLEHGAGPNRVGPSGQGLLAQAVESGDRVLVGQLLERGADPNARDRWGDTALFKLGRRGDAAMVAALVEAGAEVGACNRRNETPLHKAVVEDRLDVVKALLERGADANARDVGGRTPLTFRCLLRSREIARLLLEHGADVNLAEKREGQTALHCAVIRDNADLAAYLLAQGAEVNARDKAGRTPLRLARLLSKQAVAAVLREHGAGE